jgi:hypothetical protein
MANPQCTLPARRKRRGVPRRLAVGTEVPGDRVSMERFALAQKLAEAVDLDVAAREPFELHDFGVREPTPVISLDSRDEEEDY